MKKLFTTFTQLRFIKWLSDRTWHKHPVAAPIMTFFVLFAAGLGYIVISDTTELQASDSHLVVFTHDKKQETLPTRAKTVGEFLERANVVLYEGDVVEPNKDTEIADQKFRINVYRARPVMVDDDGKKTFAFSAATTARSVATQAGLTIYPEDKIESKMETDFLRDGAIGEKVIIDRAVPTNINLYGTTVPVRTQATTVRALLEEKQIKLAADDTVQPSLDSPISAQTQVFVVRNGSQVSTVEEEIPMQTETIEDASLSFGSTAVRQAGSAGKRLVTYQVDLQNGKEVARKEIQSVVAVEPVKQIIARGKTVFIPSDKESVMRAAGIASSDFAYVNYIISRESTWNAAARNSSSGAFGLCQALPGTKMASAGSDWATNPVTQLKWCDGYAKGRYGSWSAAYNFWLAKHYW